jgi:hypothetical protein
MLIVAATMLQHIKAQLNGAESEEDRLMATPKTVLKLVKQNDR